MIPSEVEMIEVESSQVKAIGHKEDRLYVHFKSNDAQYVYQGVTAEQFEALKDAESVGKHLNAEIKPNHSFERLN